jgi:hypothetical protein
MHTLMVTLTWALGALGVTGTIAAIAAVIFLGPTAVMAIVQPILSRFLACTACIVASAFLLSTIGSYWLGHHEAERQCRADELNSRIAAQQADLEAARRAKTDESNRASQIESEANEQHQKDSDFIKHLQAQPGCGFDPDAGAAGGLRGPHAAGTQPAAGPGAPGPGPSHSTPRFRLPFPLVRDPRMSRQGPERDAAPDGQ